MTRLTTAAVLALTLSGCTPTSAATGTGLDGLTVAPEARVDYDREAWGDWTEDGQCSTRETVLKRDGQGVRTDAKCRAVSGTWISVYDGVTVTDARSVDIDHVVPLKEAAQSGAANWSAEQRRRFYNDLGNLVAVSAKSNRSKSDQDPGEWRPVRSDWCWYARQTVAVKKTYHLTVDSAEMTALTQMLATC